MTSPKPETNWEALAALFPNADVKALQIAGEAVYSDWTGTVHYQEYLYGLVRAFISEVDSPILMVETGMSQGVSTHGLIEALKDKYYHQLITIESAFDQDEMVRRLENWKHRVDRVSTLEYDVDGYVLWEPVAQRSDEALAQFLDPWMNIFLHDSDHSYECQNFEYSYAWDHLLPGGLLISDDWVWGDGRAWKELVEKTGQPWYRLGHCAVVRKPTSP